MKGFMIYEAPLWGDEENVVYTQEVNNASYTLKQCCSDDLITCYLEGTATKDPVTKATCSKDDTYDFKTGALISLMKMCGLEKSAKAYAEVFDDTAYGDALIERDKLKEEVKSLKASICAKKVVNTKILNSYNSAQSAYEIMVEKSADLMDKVKKLEEENKLLKEKNAELIKGNSALVGARDYLLNESRRMLRDKKDLKEKYVALIAENEKIKTDCEKLQHGYIDTDMMISYVGGRQNGKQFTFLVELFKKLPQDKVEAAYKKVYHTTLPAWQKEVLNQIYGFHKESKSPANLFTISKREKMWDDILKEGRTPVWVKREDIHDFLKECERMGIKWSSGKSPLETIPFYMTDGYEGAYFFVMTSLDISKSKKGAVGTIKKFRHVMTWWATACPEEVEAAIHYIRPMRWDLFEKGRIAVKVNKENYAEFCSRILSHFTKVGISAFNHACKFGYFVFNKDTDYVERILVSDNGDAKEINRRKVVDWEDVR